MDICSILPSSFLLQLASVKLHCYLRVANPQKGRRHVPTQATPACKIWRESARGLLRYRSKTAKMQKFPIDSHSNENFICPFFRPPGAANPQKGRRHIRNQSTPACELWRESARAVVEKSLTNKQTYSKTNTSPFAILANGG